MSISSEDVHEPLGVHASGVSVSWGRSGSFDQICVLHVVAGSNAGLLLGQQLAVHVKAVVCVLNNEGVPHANAGRRSQAGLSLGFSRVLFSLRALKRLGKSGVLLGGGASQAVSAHRLATLERLVFRIGRTHVLVVVGVEVLLAVAVRKEGLGLEIKHDKIVEFFGQFDDTTEDVHLVAVHSGRVSTTGGRLVITGGLINLAPYIGLQVEEPHVIHFFIIVLLPAESVNFLVMDAD